MLVVLRSAVVWGPAARGLLAFRVAVVGIVVYKCHIPIHVSLGQQCLQGTHVSASVKGLRSLVFHCLFRQLHLCML